jgi:hypothetical protein
MLTPAGIANNRGDAEIKARNRPDSQISAQIENKQRNRAECSERRYGGVNVRGCCKAQLTTGATAKGRQMPDGAEFRRARNPEHRWIPNGAKSQTAKTARAVPQSSSFGIPRPLG